MHRQVPEGLAAGPVAAGRHHGDGRHRCRLRSKLGTTAPADGALQVTYGGKPLYWFAKDKAPGQVKGNVKDKWGKWLTVVTVAARGPSSGGTNAGTGGRAF